MSISAIIPVYNEEHRIEATLRCAAWCGDTIVVDKQSTSTRVVAIVGSEQAYFLVRSFLGLMNISGCLQNFQTGTTGMSRFNMSESQEELVSTIFVLREPVELRSRAEQSTVL